MSFNLPIFDDMDIIIKAVIIREDDVPIPVKFNPESYSISRSVKQVDKTPIGAKGAKKQFVSIGETKLTMKLYFDSYDSPLRIFDVRYQTWPITSLIQIEPEKHEPQTVIFVYGTFIFEGVVTSANPKFTKFSSLGIPVRAEIDLEITKSVTIEEEQENPNESSDRTKIRELIEGDQLWMLAAKEYDSPNEWRKIAEANEIDNPRILKNQGKMIVPVLE